jgi:hypothetical protein
MQVEIVDLKRCMQSFTFPDAFASLKSARSADTFGRRLSGQQEPRAAAGPRAGM